MATPAMKQWHEIKEKYPEHILMFRMGDFYEMFYEDAKNASKILGITLTKRGTVEKVPLAGIPYKALSQYIKKFIDNNSKVIIVEQMEDPKKCKGIVKRDIIREITPGSVAFSDLLDDKSNNYLAIYHNEYLLISDITTQEVTILSLDNLEDILKECLSYQVKEIMFFEDEINTKNNILNVIVNELKKNNIYINTLSKEYKNTEVNKYLVNKIDSTKTGISEITLIGALIQFIEKTQKTQINFLNIKNLKKKENLSLEPTTIKNLELFEGNYDKNKKSSLIYILDECQTSMGSRRLKKILIRPFIQKEKIEQRLNIVENLKNNFMLLSNIRQKLCEISDIERILGKLQNKTINPTDIYQLKESIIVFLEINELLKNEKYFYLENTKNIKQLINLTQSAISDEPSNDFNLNVIKKGFNNELEEYREIKQNTKEWLRKFEKEEREKTKIEKLKVSYNKIFGFFIEIPKGKDVNLSEDYKRKQTLVNVERYENSKLKEMENKYLSSEEKIKIIQEELFKKLCLEILFYSKDISELSSLISEIDVLSNFSNIALKNNYTKPIYSDKDIILENARHPVVEKFVEEFISNKVILKGNELHIITGPNMSGKSTYLRLVAINQLMYQIGSFVPAKTAKLPIVDAIYTRIGAHDNLALGDSTFMVEMKETNEILSTATENSLVIFDEIGRGTSTYDGISIAWSVAEYLATKIKAKTLFATHYHVLNKLSELYPNVKNLHTTLKEEENQIIFERKIKEGGTDKSYGLIVAKMAKLPKWVLFRAFELQKGFEKYDNLKDNILKHFEFEEKPIEEEKKIEKYIEQANKKKEDNSINLYNWLNQ